jgi:hypothetical protein
VAFSARGRGGYTRWRRTLCLHSDEAIKSTGAREPNYAGNDNDAGLKSRNSSRNNAGTNAHQNANRATTVNQTADYHYDVPPSGDGGN